MPEILERRVVGDPILRRVASPVDQEDIALPKIKTLIENMFYTLREKQYGIALAAPQVGESVAIAIVDLKPTPTRPDIEPYKSVLINPKITHYIGKTVMLRDGCVSVGAEDDPLYAWSERYPEVEVEWYDEKAEKHKQVFTDFLAHVMQHEIDHLNGVLYLDHVKDTKTFTTASEYLKQQKS